MVRVAGNNSTRRFQHGLYIFLLSIVLISSPVRAGQSEAWWVFLDRRDTSEEAYRQARTSLDENAVERRLRIRGEVIIEADLPFHPDDLKSLQELGCAIRTQSRFLGAVSVETTRAGGVEAIRALPHVKHVRPVATYHSVAATSAVEALDAGAPADAGIAPGKRTNRYTATDTASYGHAWNQINLIGAHLAHEDGYDGEGVRVGFLDSGFLNIDSHQAFDSLNIVGRFNALDSSEVIDTHGHGTSVVSVAAGYDPYNLIGVAPRMEVLLVRTEDASDEYPEEEDFWVAGLEWAEAHGADFISTSLGYSDWYGPADYDGNTAVTTIAADLAAARGLLVVTSAGNRGLTNLGAPADGDSVLTVGGTDYHGEWVQFASTGPTADG
ncbi:S8 family serine peptidase, partial [bacterium]|nr:S8 family serine peptidase [bacterium]